MNIVLLPPSESKLSAESGPKLNLGSLAFPELTDKRNKVLAELIKLSSGRQTKALAVLDISKKQDFELVRNQNLLSEPTAPAWQIYSGVLFEALDPHSLTTVQRAKLCELTFVQSALFGLVSLNDEIPAYRLSGDSVLPKIGSLSRFWAASCSQVLEQGNDLIIDLRSGIYCKLGPVPETVPVVVPKIMQRMKSGPPKVVSHHNKATKGRILRALAQSKSRVKSVDDLANIIALLGADLNLKVSVKNPNHSVLDVVVDVL